MKRPSIWTKFWKKLNRFLCFHPSSNDEWETKEEENGGNLPSLSEIVEHMEMIDQVHEKWYQERLTDKTDVLIIAPTAAIADQEISHSILNPVLYNDEAFSIVFRIGKRYPKEFPFLTIYLSSCQPKPNLNGLLPIRTLKVNTDSLKLEPLDDDFDTEVYQTADKAWLVSWTIPDFYTVFPSSHYCFLFDMSSVDPSQIPQHEKQKFIQLKKMVPSTFESHFHSLSHYHLYKTSHNFKIMPPPALFTEEWFSRQFGGEDLDRFLGGQVFSYRYFTVLFHNENAKWNERLFQQSIEERASDVAQWMMEQFEQTPYRWEHFIFSAQRPAYLDTGYADIEDRRKARSRAIGLLYHPHGRETLKQIGQILLDISYAYETTMTAFGRQKEPIRNKLFAQITKFFHEHFSGFKSSRDKLRHWTEELKKLCKGTPPTLEMMQEITNRMGGIKEGIIHLPVTNEPVRAPFEICENIMKYMTEMVHYEIQLVLWTMAKQLLKTKSKANRWADALTGFSFYEQAKYAAFSGILKLYGTKFKTMAETFQLGKGHMKQKNDFISL